MPGRLTLLPAVATAACLLWSRQGLAGWRYADWGMTKAEVIAASENRAKPYVVANRRPWGEYPDLVAPHADLSHQFEVRFYFDRHEERLHAIRLVPTGGFWCIDIRRKVMERYGTNHRAVDSYTVWDDVTGNNRISITGFADCTIKYEPLNR